MKGLTSTPKKGLEVGSYLVCADNSGAYVLKIISVRGYKGVRRRRGRAGIADWIKCSVKEGIPKMKKQVVNAVIIRQRAEMRRMEGIRVKFEDNAAVLINEEGEPIGSEIRGPVAREVIERFSAIGKISRIVV
ncbi:MAG: 50S ribosomal protein L14 [Candidatus Aenigmarchaeota archaeon]|nr:50S ribosomal protein L14 [Candidatus Aenigmarchaeota archaeon]MDW8149378.1 50S ribosomal protein L14 [Candidatus Aenigmarchaeota archaeon]